MRRRDLLGVAVVGLAVIGAALLVRARAVPSPTPSAPTEDDEARYTALREAMVEDGVVEWGIDDPVVIAAMQAVPRHRFVPPDYLDQAYENHPLPIGYGQTISQPYIVALMTQALEVEPGDRVLEIGTGSGYQAAVLAEVGVRVYTMEIIEPLASAAAARLSELGYDDIAVRNSDGYYGWPEAGPFDGIIVTAAPDHVPQPLLQQLAVGGVMVLPVGPPGGYQELWRIRRISTSEVESTNLGGVRFVPLIHTSSGFAPEE